MAGRILVTAAPGRDGEMGLPSAAIIEALRGQGLEAFVVTPEGINERRALRCLEGMDGVVLPGGGDVDPDLYGEGFKAVCNRGADEGEIAICRVALKLHKPVLGVCRGMQVMNVALHGTLWGDTRMRAGMGHMGVEHGVRLVPGSALAGMYEPLPVVIVNSTHVQAVRKPGAGCAATAIAPDGIVEGLETKCGHGLGVQWHPERLANGQAVFKALRRAIANGRF